MAMSETTASVRAQFDEAQQRQQMIRAMVASAVGTSIEWYDFFLYGVAAALVFPQKFFPQSDPFVATLLSFSTYFVGFAARPIGAPVFCPLCRRPRGHAPPVPDPRRVGRLAISLVVI